MHVNLYVYMYICIYICMYVYVSPKAFLLRFNESTVSGESKSSSSQLRAHVVHVVDSRGSSDQFAHLAH